MTSAAVQRPLDGQGPPILYTVQEAAQVLRKSASWLYQNHKRFPSGCKARIGGRLVFTDEHLRRIIELGAVDGVSSRSR